MAIAGTWLGADRQDGVVVGFGVINGPNRPLACPTDRPGVSQMAASTRPAIVGNPAHRRSGPARPFIWAIMVWGPDGRRAGRVIGAGVVRRNDSRNVTMVVGAGADILAGRSIIRTGMVSTAGPDRRTDHEVDRPQNDGGCPIIFIVVVGAGPSPAIGDQEVASTRPGRSNGVIRQSRAIVAIGSSAGRFSGPGRPRRNTICTLGNDGIGPVVF